MSILGRIFSQSLEKERSIPVGRVSPRIYDSSKFPFYQAELYHQFHDPDTSKKQRAQTLRPPPLPHPTPSQASDRARSAPKGEKYKALREALLRRGRLQPVSCPESEVEASSGGDCFLIL